MGIVSRFFLLLYVLVVFVAVLIFAGVCLKIIPPQIWQNYLNYIIVQRETVIILAIMTFFSLFFLGYVFSSRKEDERANGEIILKKGEPGEVKVAVDAIRHLTERAALTVSGVREVKVIINKSKDEAPISIRLTIVLGQGHSAPAVSEAVVNTIDKVIFSALQISNVPVDVSVKDITNAVVERKQRVV